MIYINFIKIVLKIIYFKLLRIKIGFFYYFTRMLNIKYHNNNSDSNKWSYDVSAGRGRRPRASLDPPRT